MPAERSSNTAGSRVCWVASSVMVSTRNGASNWSIAPAGKPTADLLVWEKSPCPNIRPPRDMTCPPPQLPMVMPETRPPASCEEGLRSSSMIRFVTRIGAPLRASTKWAINRHSSSSSTNSVPRPINRAFDTRVCWAGEPATSRSGIRSGSGLAKDIARANNSADNSTSRDGVNSWLRAS